MTTQTGIGSIITLTNTHTVALTITDIKPKNLYIPASASVSLPFTGDVAESYFNGVIRGFMGGAQGLYGTTSGVNATGNHPTYLTASFTEVWPAGQVTVETQFTMTTPNNATVKVYWAAPNKAITITDLAVNFPIATKIDVGCAVTAQKVAGSVNLLLAATDLDTGAAAPDALANTFVSIPLVVATASRQVAAGGAVWVQCVGAATWNTSDAIWRITYTVD